MNENFLEAVKTYLDTIEDACNLLIEYIEKEEQITILNKYDLYNYFHRSDKYEFNIEEKRYFRHGNGMRVVCKDMIVADWNFGCKSWWCGIDPFLMAVTLRNSGFKDSNYHNGDYIKSKCEQYVMTEFLYYYKGQYYVNLLKFSCTKVEFPDDYDRVLIEFKGVKKLFPKSKLMDKFIRKSNLVYAGIGELKNNYVLIFYNDGTEVARVPYNDIAYPDSAVKIMNGEIIKPHIVDMWKPY